MTELHWRAATDTGSYDGTALISVGQGAVHLRTDLPAGTLENAVATLSWPMAENEKIFMNGFSGNLVLLCVPGVVVFACNGMLSVLTTLISAGQIRL